MPFVGAKLTKAAEQAPAEELQVFVRPGCPYCEAAKRFLPELQRRWSALRIEIRDIAEDRRALADLQNLADRFGLHPISVPAFYLRGKLIVGFDSAATTGRELTSLLNQPPTDALTNGPALPFPCPCLARSTCAVWGCRFSPSSWACSTASIHAMWVLLFLLSMLINLRDRKKMFLIGGVFVTVSGLVYFTFMAGWLNIFFLIGRSR